jgi:pyruvate kinase
MPRGLQAPGATRAAPMNLSPTGSTSETAGAEAQRTAPPSTPSGVDDLIADLSSIRRDMMGLEARLKPQLAKLDASHQASARNLVHYLALRRRDVRDLQERLARAGLSSLGRAESHVLANVDALLGVLHKLADRHPPNPDMGSEPIDFAKGKALLKRHAEDLLGPVPANRGVRILVTLPVEAADDYTLVHSLVEGGMDCARINCAHDTREVWERMIANVRRAERQVGRKCRVLMDLAGPKLRTGQVEPGPTVVKVRPERDAFGNVVAHARLWLTAAERPSPPPTPADAALAVPGEWVARLREGDVIEFQDVRGKKRELTVLSFDRHGHWAKCDRTAYLAPGLTLSRKSRDDEDSDDEALLGFSRIVILEEVPSPRRMAGRTGRHRVDPLARCFPPVEGWLLAIEVP